MKTLRLLFTLWLAVLGASYAYAESTRPSPIIELNMHFFTGEAGQSLKGASGYSVIFRSEDVRGFFRPHVAFEVGMASGNASIGVEEPAFSMYRASFLPGFHLVMIPSGTFQPYLGANVNLGWGFFQMETPPTGVEPSTQGFTYGYEVSAGVDLKFAKSKPEGIRLSSSVITVFSSLAGVSGFQLNSFRFGLGYVF